MILICLFLMIDNAKKEILFYLFHRSLSPLSFHHDLKKKMFHFSNKKDFAKKFYNQFPTKSCTFEKDAYREINSLSCSKNY